MIEVVSWPPVPSQWVPAGQPYYFELYGETRRFSIPRWPRLSRRGRRRTASSGPDKRASGPAVTPMAAKPHPGIYPKDTEAIWVPGPDARTFIELMISSELPGTAR